ncbi:MAG: signal peptidase I [Ruminococcus sp.]
MKIIKKIINIIIDILVILVLLVSAVILTFSLTSQDTGAPNIFGYTLNSIQTPSMEPEMYAGDLVIGRNTPNTDNYSVGDIVFFQSSVFSKEEQTEVLAVKCHRIIKVKEEDGETKYLTKGDNNKASDIETDGWLSSDKIIGIYETESYKGTKIGGFGSVIDFLQSFWGFFFVIVLPMILFFIYELVRVIMNIVAYTKEKALVAATEAAQSAELTEAQKQKAIEEYLASQVENENDDKPDTREEKEE